MNTDNAIHSIEAYSYSNSGFLTTLDLEFKNANSFNLDLEFELRFMISEK